MMLITISRVVISQWLEMDWLHRNRGEQSCLQLFRLIVTWWQWQQGWAGLASDTEHQPSLLAHIQPSVLISRYVLTIALMCLLSGGAFAPPPRACLVCAMPQQPAVFSFPITEGTVELKSVEVLSLPWNGWVIEGTQVTGFGITWAGKCGGCG